MRPYPSSLARTGVYTLAPPELLKDPFVFGVIWRLFLHGLGIFYETVEVCIGSCDRLGHLLR